MMNLILGNEMPIGMLIGTCIYVTCLYIYKKHIKHRNQEIEYV